MIIAPNNVLCRHKHLMGYFEFLQCSRIICFPLNIPEKLHGQHLFEKPEEAETYHLTIHMHTEEQQTGTTTTFSFGYQSCIWPHSDPFCCQNPCSGCNSGIDLAVVVEYNVFRLCSNTEQIC